MAARFLWDINTAQPCSGESGPYVRPAGPFPGCYITAHRRMTNAPCFSLSLGVSGSFPRCLTFVPNTDRELGNTTSVVTSGTAETCTAPHGPRGTERELKVLDTQIGSHESIALRHDPLPCNAVSISVFFPITVPWFSRLPNMFATHPLPTKMLFLSHFQAVTFSKSSFSGKFA